MSQLDQLFRQAVVLHREGRLSEAETLYSQILQVQPDHFDAMHHIGIIKGQRGQNREAENLITAALRLRPNSLEALSSFANVLSASRRHEQALAIFQKILTINPRDVGALVNCGNALCELERYDEAIAALDQALAIVPNNPAAHYNRASVLQRVERYEAALAGFDKALAIAPGYAQALNGRGRALDDLGRYADAVESCRKAIALKPDYADAHCNLGNAFFHLGRAPDALAAYERALAIKPDLAEAWLGRGNVCFGLKRHAEALSAYENAVRTKPDLAEAWFGAGNVFFETRRGDVGIAAYEKALDTKPELADAWIGYGNALFELRRYDEALAAYDKAVARNPALKGSTATARLLTKTALCQWSDWDIECQHIISAVRSCLVPASPAALMMIPASPADQLHCATVFAKTQSPASADPIWRGERYSHDRIRIAYLSADFHNHATALLMAGSFERHDRARFETTALSFGPADGSEMRVRLKRSFDRFVDVCMQTDAEIADCVRNLEIDIAVDLKGFTPGARAGIFARRPAPIQVNYLGYPGTMGVEYIDYIIADRVVIPPDHHQYYSEKVVYLPESYQANDAKRCMPDTIPNRTDSGLPETGFVFCSFNAVHKISPVIFEVWMRLLRTVDGSVLWLLGDHATAAANLKREAEKRGVSPERLIFAARTEHESHMARQRLADLFLDTLPCNAHTTASDALWAGLPVLTCLGSTFAGRVAASLLHAVMLPDLITRSLDEYEALALKIAREPVLLSSFKERIANNRLTCPLFNTQRFTRHIEAAYRTMWEKWQRGEGPSSFNVDPTDSLENLKAS